MDCYPSLVNSVTPLHLSIYLSERYRVQSKAAAKASIVRMGKCDEEPVNDADVIVFSEKNERKVRYKNGILLFIDGEWVKFPTLVACAKYFNLTYIQLKGRVSYASRQGKPSIWIDEHEYFIGKENLK